MAVLRVALVGAPNCGKTVLFNALTGARAKVANYPGVTVDRRSGVFTADKDIEILDLPGTYSLHTTSPDEEVTRQVLLGQRDSTARPNVILAVADATNLRMSLRMLLELKQLGLPMLTSLNLSDVARRRGLQIDIPQLSRLLGMPVVETTAISHKGTQALKQALLDFPKSTHSTPSTAPDIENLDSEALYRQADQIIQAVVIKQTRLPVWHQRLDQVVLHPILGLLLLSTVLLLTFQAVYSWSAPLMDGIESLIGQFANWVGTRLPEGILHSLLVDGIIAGVGSVVVFLPQITILFLFILLLEDSGYLPRAAFLLDNLFDKIGLSGRTFIPLLSSFACAVPSIMSARTISNPRERLVTIAIAPLMTCSARLPVYALLIGAFIPQRTVGGVFNLQGLTLFILYLIGILSAVLVAWFMKRLAKRRGGMRQFPLLMELPTYRMPNFKHIALSLWERISAFLKKAGSIIFALSVILWALVSFPAAPADATLPSIEYSFAGILGQWIEPLFAPLRFNWQICIAMITGLAAREVVVASLGTIYAVAATSDELLQQSLVPILHDSWDLPTAFALLTWYIYAPMCAATLVVIKRETNSTGKTLLIIGYLTALAYFGAWVVYHLTTRILT
ncbi:ferrous iron transporter B [Testudinibacter sp. TR-2022]|uniref:ferrous iron transporter B n=1 Tax=Testudinibacter sp. TR-2022 TaxID=2585029 RepID=UPI00111AC062|nr:ferrous iron transporter B [Testudinibacter sp. TR-2022]TNH09439.1 ferrous iron transporter B [Pasteurellaceae bacterium Phil11]TNH20968.1 ferrous iron transporter B [Testudinibacter sp. TR-2022]TNH28405.1 ferrous iron transporter B [Testudinibacter sp. TR-2022]